MRNINKIAWGLVLSLMSATLPARASTIHFQSGLSTAGVPVAFEAHLTISGDILTIDLINSSPVASLNPSDVLGSYYFDIVDGGGNRPSLSYVSAVGDVYLTSQTAPDSLQTAGANLKALNPGARTWQYRAMMPSSNPFLGFGLGTVGNSNLAPNNFQGNIVGNLDYAVYRGDVTTSNLSNKLLVRETATFTFSGVSGFTEADISPRFAFGLGTAPDSFLVPEPGSVIFMAVAVLLLLPLRCRHQFTSR